MTLSEPTIQISNLWKSYGDQPVLCGLNLEVAKSEVLAIVGRSGVGKSVLLRQIIGLDIPDQGTVIVEGKNLSHLSDHEKLLLIRRMGFLFQSNALFDSMTILDNVLFPLRHHSSLTDKEQVTLAQEALAAVHLLDSQKLLPGDLSGGMRKRAALARLLVYRPAIVLLDEPTSGLDSITTIQIRDLLSQVQRSLQSTTILVTHDLTLAAALADRIALHCDGKISYIEKPELFIKIKDPIIRGLCEGVIVE